jgi:hypothetical protein
VNIKLFTQELPLDGKLAVLDTSVHILEDGSTKVTVHRKPTHTDQYLSFTSHHPLEHKRSVVRTLMHRAQNIVTLDEDKDQEKAHVRSALRANGYKDWALNIPQKPLPQPKPKTTPAGIPRFQRPIGIPYVQGLSEHLQRLFLRYNIRLYHKHWNTLREKLVHPKDKLKVDQKSEVVYEIKCPSCDSLYIGETSCTFGQRFREHLRVKGKTTAIGDHINATKHKFQLKDCKILDSASGRHERRVKEALYIQEAKPNLNRDTGLELPWVYGQLLSLCDRCKCGHVTSQ